MHSYNDGVLSGDTSRAGRRINHCAGNYPPIRRMIRQKIDFFELLNIDNSTLFGLDLLSSHVCRVQA